MESDSQGYLFHPSAWPQLLLPPLIRDVYSARGSKRSLLRQTGTTMRVECNWAPRIWESVCLSQKIIVVWYELWRSNGVFSSTLINGDRIEGLLLLLILFRKCLWNQLEEKFRQFSANFYFLSLGVRSPFVFDRLIWRGETELEELFLLPKNEWKYWSNFLPRLWWTPDDMRRRRIKYSPITRDTLGWGRNGSKTGHIWPWKVSHMTVERGTWHRYKTTIFSV